MAISKKKRIEELEKELDKVKRERDTFVCQLGEYKEVVAEMTKAAVTKPEDCVLGHWCAACEFAKEYRILHYGAFGAYNVELKHLCGKGESCQHFVQREISD